MLLGATVTAGIALGALGVTSSYQALLNKAAASPAAGGWGWGAHPWMLPIGVDVTILAFSLVHLLMIKTERPVAWVRWLPRFLAAVTAVLNWSSGVTFQGRLGHAVLVSVWIAFSEVAAHIYASHINALSQRQQMERIRFVRWLFMPLSSVRLYRLMRCWEITSYREALERDRQRMGYRSGLRDKHGRVWRVKAPEDQLRPLRLLGYGMTLEQALEEPDRQDEAQALRAERRELRQAEARIRAVEVQARVQAAHARAEALAMGAAADLQAPHAQTDTAAPGARGHEGDLHPCRGPATAQLTPYATTPGTPTGHPGPADPVGPPAPTRQPDQHSRHHEPARLLTGHSDHQRHPHATGGQRAASPELKHTTTTPTTPLTTGKETHEPGPPYPRNTATLTAPAHGATAEAPADPAATQTPGKTSRQHTAHNTQAQTATSRPSTTQHTPQTTKTHPDTPTPPVEASRGNRSEPRATPRSSPDFRPSSARSRRPRTERLVCSGLLQVWVTG
ncbi:DUF2637 domain-containing protein [Actinacidiphila glaucinigra]|uniref:DUF2637 domain-containing protein n=1 Tax=Actinacidiphila glaucinigra TaxID=235986 RepID=UPI0037C9E3CE